MTPPAGTVILNVCALPPATVADECVRLSRAGATEHSVLTLGGGRFPHLTLYMARFAREVLPAVQEHVGLALRAAEEADCSQTGFFTTAGHYVEVSYAASPGLRALHTELVKQLAPLRVQPGRPYVEDYFAPYTDAQRRNAEATGYDLAGDLFRPHITLARYPPGHVPDGTGRQPTPKLSFSVGEVALYEADDNGAVHTRQATWTLPPT